MLHRVLIKEPLINWPLMAVIWVVNYLLFVLGLWLVGDLLQFNLVGDFTKLAAIVAAAVSTFKKEVTLVTISPMYKGKLLFLGAETDLWLTPGFYFLPRIFFIPFWSIFRREMQSDEKDEIILPQFRFQDKKGKLVFGKGNATFAPGSGTNDEALEKQAKENYKLMQEKDIKENLMNLLRQTCIRVFGPLDYWTEMLGKELQDKILDDDVLFKKQCFKYGVYFKTFNVEVISGNLEQDDLNAYRASLTAELKGLYTELEDSEIAKMVSAQIGILQQYDITGNSGAKVTILTENRKRNKPDSGISKKNQKHDDDDSDDDSDDSHDDDHGH